MSGVLDRHGSGGNSGGNNIVGNDDGYWNNDDSDPLYDEHKLRIDTILTVMNRLEELREMNEILYLETGLDVVEIGPDDSIDYVHSILENLPTSQLTTVSIDVLYNSQCKPISCKSMEINQRYKRELPDITHIDDLTTLAVETRQSLSQVIFDYLYLIKSDPSAVTKDVKEHILFPLLADRTVTSSVREFLLTIGIDRDTIDLQKTYVENVKTFEEMTGVFVRQILAIQDLDIIAKRYPNWDVYACYLGALDVETASYVIESILIPMSDRGFKDQLQESLCQFGYEYDDEMLTWHKKGNIKNNS